MAPGEDEVIVAVEQGHGTVLLGMDPTEARRVAATLLSIADELEHELPH